MTNRFEPARGLDEVIARRFAQPAVAKALRMLKDEARKWCPACRVWITMRDERVRPTHVETDTQTIPANLRFQIPKYPGAKQYDLARHPRDPDLPVGQRIHCRCDDPLLVSPLRDSIVATDVTVAGCRVSGSVETRFPRAAESEVGGGEDQGAYFMQTALMEVSARLRAGHAR